MKWIKMIKNSKGHSLILLLFIIPVLLGLLGLTIDLAMIYSTQAKLQNGVDFTALSSVKETKINHGQVVETAIHIAKENGIKTRELQINHPYQKDNLKVEIIATRQYEPIFMSIFGISSKTIQARAVAKLRYRSTTTFTDQALDYAVFHGSTTVDMHIQGNNSLIQGNVHSNKKIAIHGKGHNVTGRLEAIDGISGDMSSITGTIISKNAPILPTPNFNFEELANHADRVFNSNMIFNNVTIDGIWLINGDVTLNGGRISGKGIILARGSISLPSNSVEYSSSNDLLALYSLGDITLSCTKNQISGILYAPNGTIRIAGSNNTFYGALIANEVYWATKDIVINGNYDLRAPSAFTIEEEETLLIE